MFDWFIYLAYALEGCVELYILLVFVIFCFIWICVYNYEKKLELEEKAENYEKLRDFLDYIYGNDSARDDVSDYLESKKRDEEYGKNLKDIDDFMNIL